MICTVWIYNARKYNNEGRRRQSAGAHHVSEVQPARTRWREVRRLFPSGELTGLYQGTMFSCYSVYQLKEEFKGLCSIADGVPI